MIKYQIGFSNNEIFEVEILKETEKTFWLKELDWKDEETIVEKSKNNNFMPIFDTFDEAKGFLIEKANLRIRRVEKELIRAKKHLEEVKNLKNNLNNN